MKIEKLIIYGFGKHENVTVDFGPGINVLYGLNEAGKTTIQQFILHILFGFPQKNSVVLRYEPKSGGKYGGQVVLMDDVLGRCSVERVRGKSAGEVTVYFEDGTRGGEEAVMTLLRQYERASFESIFSFSLLQLQGFEKMDEDELSRTLLASGTTGVDSLLQLEKKLEKELGDLFKKSGRNPEINVKLAELRELELELKDEQAKVEEYAPSIKRINVIDERLCILRDEEKALREDSQKLTLIRQFLPLHSKKKGLESRLVQVNTVNFPADGIRRFESLTGKLTETEATKRRIEEDLFEMTARMPGQHKSEQITEIELLLARESEWHSWRTTNTAAEDEMRRLLGLKRRLLDRLGVKEEEAETILFQADVSIRKEEEMHDLLKELAEGDRQIGFVERKLVDSEIELIDTKKKIESIERSTPSDEELRRMREWPQIRTKLAEAKAFVSLGRRPVEQKLNMIPAVLLLVALAFVVFGFIQKEWIVAIAGIVLAVVGAFLYPKKGTQLKTSSDVHEMEKFISKYDGKEVEMEQLIGRIELYTREKKRLQEAFTAIEQKHSTIEHELDSLHSKRRNTEFVLTEFLRNYGFDGLPSTGIVPELFRMIREVQEAARDLEETAEVQRMVQVNIDKRSKEAEKALQKVVPPDAIYEMLRREFIQLKEEAETAKSLKAGMKRSQAMLQEITELAASLQGSLHDLLVEAGAETEDEFYTAYNAYQEKVRLTEQLLDIESQLAANGPHELREDTTDEELIEQVNNNGTLLSSIDEELEQLINEKAALINMTERLLTDETSGRKLQLFEMKKAELAELAKKWSESKAMAEAIRQTMTELKEKKLPEVVQGAEAIFHDLTGGKYESIGVTREGYFEALSEGGMRYPIVELSQATKEQAYISLRLALASSVLGTAPFPIIMDDPFVHFDGERLSRMIELIENLQQRHQFIYFTCHETMKDKWTNATIINVSNIGSGQGAIVV